MAKWYLGSMNDGLFIIDKRPMPAPDDTGPYEMPNGPKPVSAALDERNANLIVEAHNAVVQSLSAERDQLAARLTEANTRIEQQAAAFVKFAKERPVAPHPIDQMENLRRAMTTDIEIEKLEAALASIPEAGEEAARAENEWRPVESAPRDGTRILLSLWHFNDPAKGRWEVVGSWIAELGDWASETYERLWPPTHWRPLPPPPTEPTK